MGCEVAREEGGNEDEKEEVGDRVYEEKQDDDENRRRQNTVGLTGGKALSALSQLCPPRRLPLLLLR